MNLIPKLHRSERIIKWHVIKECGSVKPRFMCGGCRKCRECRKYDVENVGNVEKYNFLHFRHFLHRISYIHYMYYIQTPQKSSMAVVSRCFCDLLSLGWLPWSLKLEFSHYCCENDGFVLNCIKRCKCRKFTLVTLTTSKLDFWGD